MGILDTLYDQPSVLKLIEFGTFGSTNTKALSKLEGPKVCWDAISFF